MNVTASLAALRLLDAHRRDLLRELAQIDAETKARPDEPMLDHYRRAGAIAARVNVIVERGEDVWRRLRSGRVADDDAVREISALLAAS
jgi:hypothetical protein